MDLWFGKAHQETLKRLQELCDKHGGYIIYGVRASADNDDIEEEIVDYLIKEEILIKDEYGDYEYETKISSTQTFWLEYHDKDKKLHNLVYSIYEYCVEGDGIVNHEYDGNSYYNTKSTIISNSFDLHNQDVHLNYPYRWGVVLGSFANHVAHLLGEPNKMKGITY